MDEISVAWSVTDEFLQMNMPVYVTNTWKNVKYCIHICLSCHVWWLFYSRSPIIVNTLILCSQSSSIMGLLFFSVSCDTSRFGLDIDLDAPKVRIPLTSNEHFVLDLGHFTLHTRVSSSFRTCTHITLFCWFWRTFLLNYRMEHGMKKDRVCIHAFILLGGIWLLFLFVV
jgi:hypothetical protein